MDVAYSQKGTWKRDIVLFIHWGKKLYPKGFIYLFFERNRQKKKKNRPNEHARLLYGTSNTCSCKKAMFAESSGMQIRRFFNPIFHRLYCYTLFYTERVFAPLLCNFLSRGCRAKIFGCVVGLIKIINHKL